MKTLSALMAACSLGAVVTFSAFGLSDTRTEGTPATATTSSPIQPLSEVLGNSVRRETFPTVQFVSVNDGDAPLGRRYILLEGHVLADQPLSLLQYAFEPGTTLDIETIIYESAGARTTCYFLESPDPEFIQLLGYLKSFIAIPDFAGTTAINMDPPLRMNQGDIILFVMEDDPSTFGGYVHLNMHGTLPVGDTLSVR